ncbi:MAG TPA: hypothetical protein VKR52_17025 [Terracidiphilus sp.]|nr:hypothetical protein [Terracidiphilus sp.]
MSVRGWGLTVVVAILAAGGVLAAQSPTAYTVVTNKPMVSAGTVITTYRLGPKVMIDEKTAPPEVSGSHIIRIKTFIDLDKNQSILWDPANPAAPCVIGAVAKDWGDPFGGAASIAGAGATEVGADALHGLSVSVMEATTPNGYTRAWVDPKTGLVLKAQRIPLAGDPVLLMEVTSVSFAAPPASMFGIPTRCGGEGEVTSNETAEAAGGNDEITALTGGNSKDYVNAMTGPASAKSCTMEFRVVKAGTLAPITGTIQVAADLKLASETNPHYTVGAGENGRLTFSGGGLHEIVEQPNHGFKIDAIPETFELDVEFGDAGSAAAKIYRQCSAAKTALLFVVRDPQNPSAGGAWVWAKSGRFAVAAR